MLLSHEEFVSRYLDGENDCYSVCIGTREVDLEKVIASLQSLEEVQGDETMQILRKSTLENGWMEAEDEVFLTLAPNGKYSIGHGIHRLVLAQEFGLESFRATIILAVPSKYLNRSDFREIEPIESHLRELTGKINEIKAKHGGGPTIPKADLNLINVYSNMCERSRKKIDVVYQNVALREGLLPRYYFENKGSLG